MLLLELYCKVLKKKLADLFETIDEITGRFRNLEPFQPFLDALFCQAWNQFQKPSTNLIYYVTLKPLLVFASKFKKLTP